MLSGHILKIDNVYRIRKKGQTLVERQIKKEVDTKPPCMTRFE